MSDLGTWGAAANAAAAQPEPDSGIDVSPKNSSADAPWPVAKLAAKLREYIDRLGHLWIEGEVTKINRTNAGVFLSLKDLTSDTSVDVSCFAGGKVPADTKQGDRVIALIKPTYWAKSGKLSMQASEIRKVGLGDLLERIEKLRAQLAAEGLTQVKQPLPFLPNLIGLVTGKDSDAEKDVLQNAKLRWPEVQFRVIHTPVQGATAAPAIIDAIKTLDADPAVDVIIVARGGGSFMDLFVFSDEALVRAAAATTKPLVSAIGHENDRPVLDDVADLRASTPTDAAKRVVPDIVEERAKLQQLRVMLHARVSNQVNNQLELISQIRSRPILANPYTFTQQLATELDQVVARASQALNVLLGQEALRLDHLKQQVRALSPQATLDRGYAVVRDSKGQVLTDSSKVKPGTGIKVRIAKGEITATTT
ncbi:MAG: exodeoxyribonuclease VII large subunit [Micrococcales bacterium]